MPILPLSTLTEIVATLADVDSKSFDAQEPTIYVAEPWNPQSLAVVEWSPYKGGLPDIACKHGLVRLLEVDIAQNFLDQRRASTEQTLSAVTLATDLIAYVKDLVAAGDGFAVGPRFKRQSP